MLFQDWIGSKRDLVLSGEEVDEVGIYYLGSCISPSGPVLDWISSRIPYARRLNAFSSVVFLEFGADVKRGVLGHKTQPNRH